MRLGSYMTRTSRRGAFFGSRLATMMTSLIPRRWDVRRLHRIGRRAIEPVTIARLEPFARDTSRELYHQFCNIVGGVRTPLWAFNGGSVNYSKGSYLLSDADPARLLHPLMSITHLAIAPGSDRD